MAAPKHGRARDRGWYLRYAKAENFGAFSQTTLGPFGPGLNVVHGVNEAGKTTFANLIEGVMFGWGDGRSAQNTYKPAGAERSGELMFLRADGDSDKKARLGRVKNADGVQGDKWLLDDIDRETYREIFALNSDQLMRMGDASQVTSRLLTASAGTATSPSQVREALDARIAEYTSRSSKYPHSITRLIARRDELACAIDKAREQADALRGDEVELARMDEERAAVQDTVNAENEFIEHVSQSIAAVEQMTDRCESLKKNLVDLERDQADEEAVEDYSDVPARLMQVGDAQDEALRERIDVLERASLNAEKAVDEARRNYESALEGYEQGLVSADSDDGKKKPKLNGHLGQTALFAIVAVLFAVLGAVMSVVGDSNAASLITGLFFGAVAFALASVGCAVWGLVGGGQVLSAEVSNSKWLVEKEKNSFEAAQKRQAEVARSAESQLAGLGLAKANGDWRAARALLDRAKVARQQKAILQRAAESFEARRAELQLELELNERRLCKVIEDCGGDVDQGVEGLQESLNQAANRRNRAVGRIEEVNLRAGKIEQRLAEARSSHDLDELRVQHQQVVTRLADSQRELARLLLARKMLDDAIGDWQGSSQPEVYQEAGRLLSRMTGGRWRQVTADAEGRLMVVDALGASRDPHLLSTGTCQQLYLAMRIALLNTAEFVGTNVPIICDDILVHFDEKRRKAAAKALVHLARNRQVILFTCHKDIVSTLRWADLSCNVIEL